MKARAWPEFCIACLAHCLAAPWTVKRPAIFV
jgi:hypothetical protein